MQQPYQHTLTPADRTTFANSLLAILAFYAALVVVAVLLSLAMPRQHAVDASAAAPSPDPFSTGISLL